METETTELESTESTEEAGSDDTEESGAETQETTSEDRPSRKERRANKLAEANRAASEASELRRELAEERAARQRHAEELAEMRGQLNARQQQDKPDPFDGKLKELREKRNRHLAASATAASKEHAERELDAYHEALEEIDELRGERRQSKNGQERQQQPDYTQVAQKMALESEFPWLASNKAARTMADGYVNVLVGKGRPMGMATYKEACALAAKDLGLGGTGGQSNGKGRFSVPSGRTGASGEAGSSSFSANDMTRQQEALAEQLYNHLPKEQAHAKWARDVYPKTVKQTA